MNRPLIISRNITLMGYLGIWLLLPLWYAWLAPSAQLPLALILALLLLPLLFPLKGLITGRPYTYAWSAFLSLFYFTHGVLEAYSLSAERLYGLIEIVCSLMWFSGAVAYSRLHKKAAAT